ncbi:hypothetical protein QUP01_002692, partial [Enterococcus faecalis]|nr:hypothetical protein [Enterococcus faecalis]
RNVDKKLRVVLCQGFVFEDEDEVIFSSPQEMYEDYKKKKIKGVLDYQTDILTEYFDCIGK